MSLPKWVSIHYKNDREYARLIDTLSVALEALEDVGSLDCEQYDKHLSPKTCGSCVSCGARRALHWIGEV